MILRLILSILLLPALASAGQGMGPGPGFKTYGTADYCTGKLGSYSLYFDADHPDGTTTACLTSGTTTVSATTGIDTTSTAMNMTSGGTYGVSWDGAADHYLTVPATGLTDLSGRVEFKFKFPSTMPTSNFAVWEWGSTSAGAKILLQYSATGAGGNPGFRMSIYHYDGSTISTATSYVASTTLASSEQILIIDWSSTAGYLYGSFGGQTANFPLTVTEFTEGANCYFGENIMSNVPSQTVGYDDIKIGASQQ